MYPKNARKIIRACALAFEGKKASKIAKALKVSEVTVSRWRKTELWQKTEASLLEKEISRL